MVDMKTYETMHEKDPDDYIEEHSRLDPWPLTISKTTVLSDKALCCFQMQFLDSSSKPRNGVSMLSSRPTDGMRQQYVLDA